LTRALKLYRAALKPYLILSTVVTCFLLLVSSSNNRTLEERNRAPHVSRARDDANHTHPIAPLRPYFDVLAAATRSPRRARNGRRMAVGGSFLLHSVSAAPAGRVVTHPAGCSRSRSAFPSPSPPPPRRDDRAAPRLQAASCVRLHCHQSAEHPPLCMSGGDTWIWACDEHPQWEPA
jgi:hypothetical protein